MPNWNSGPTGRGVGSRSHVHRARECVPGVCFTGITTLKETRSSPRASVVPTVPCAGRTVRSAAGLLPIPLCPQNRNVFCTREGVDRGANVLRLAGNVHRNCDCMKRPDVIARRLTQGCSDGRGGPPRRASTPSRGVNVPGLAPASWATALTEATTTTLLKPVRRVWMNTRHAQLRTMGDPTVPDRAPTPPSAQVGWAGHALRGPLGEGRGFYGIRTTRPAPHCLGGSSDSSTRAQRQEVQ